MKNIFNLFKRQEKKRVTITITDGDFSAEVRVSSIYNFDNTLKPIVLTIPKGQEYISIDNDDIVSMVQFIQKNYPDPDLERGLRILGKMTVNGYIGKMPKVFLNMTFDFVDPNKVEEGFQYFAAAILKGENNKEIAMGIFFNVVKEENINKYFVKY